MGKSSIFKIVDFLKKTIHLNRALCHFVWLYCGASADEAMGCKSLQNSH
tara:strand:- start:236 stop:382 length:147 start_codon:yes stop_codon:yes gene_type:complete